MDFDLKAIERKWQKEWQDSCLFEPFVEKKKEAFYIQVAYPYPSGAMHIGHARTYTVTDIVAKYNMLKGKNVLMPMGWHVSGTPVIASVEALEKNDPKTVKKFTEIFHIPAKDLEELKTPEFYVDYMVNKAEYGYKAGFKRLGFGIDWRRELKTIDPQYKKFIEWQYKKLYEKGFIRKGKYPVRYCPHDDSPVGDHDLLEGEGVGFQEFTLLKFKMDNGQFVVAATLRPETVFGQTNLWLAPKVEYAIIKVGDEEWIGSNEFFEKLKEQKKGIEKIGTIKGSELVGKMVLAPGIERKIPILPSFFCDTGTGTGIVTSVPSDAPIDYVALLDLQKDKDLIKKFGLSEKMILGIKVIPIIKTKEFGDKAAVEIVKRLGIKNQFDSKLEGAKKEVYKTGFHKGVMNENCGKFAGMPVNKAKELVKKELIEQGKADVFFELEGKVVCRCGTECVVRVLEDQWFVSYSDPKWKEQSKKTLEGMSIVPELFRTQYNNVFDWLEDKPCTRSKGLGTEFPWQKGKIIEPLGDSTIYMAYFTVSHLIKRIEAQKLSEEVFDFIFLGKGNIEKISKENGIEKELLEEMRSEFNYWYPLAFNVSAIELIPNHMSFSIFQHTAIFPPEKRQLGTINLGMLVLEGKKMSSSKGNVVLINDLCEQIGADFVRFFLMNSVEPWEEMDWKPKEIEKGVSKLKSFIGEIAQLAVESKDSEKLEPEKLQGEEAWLYHRFNSRVNAFIDHMERIELRSAAQQISFLLAKDLQWFNIRKKRDNKPLYLYITKNFVKCLAPFMPHISEEIWRNLLGNKRSVFLEKLPEKKEIDCKIELAEEFIKRAFLDLKEIKKIIGKEKLQKAVFYTASEWKWNVLKKIKKLERPDFKEAIKTAMTDLSVKEKGKAAIPVIKFLNDRLIEFKEIEKINELKVLESAKEFFEKEFNCSVFFFNEEKAEFDPQKKASKALPFKPAIYVE